MYNSETVSHDSDFTKVVVHSKILNLYSSEILFTEKRDKIIHAILSTNTDYKRSKNLSYSVLRGVKDKDGKLQTIKTQQKLFS